MREADKDGRYPLTGREYEAMRTLWGAMNALQGDDLKARLQTTKDGWKALKTAEAFMQKAIEALNMTIPLNKLLTLQRELKEDMTNKEMNAAIINGMSNAIIGGGLTGAMKQGAAAGGLGLATGAASLGSTAISAAGPGDTDGLHAVREDPEGRGEVQTVQGHCRVLPV